MCECTPRTPGRFCGQPGCTDPALREQAKNASRYLKWRADHTRGADDEITPLGLALSDAWTPEQVDAALDAAPEAHVERDSVAQDRELPPFSWDLLPTPWATVNGGYTADQVIAYLDQELAAQKQRWCAVVAHAVAELEPLDDETAQAQARALRELLGAE